MKLYLTPGACSISAHIALREAGLPFEFETVDLKAGKTKSGANFHAINPKRYIPALVLDDGSVLTEGAVMVQWIADQKPALKLAPPAGTMERYRLAEWLHYIATELHTGIRPLFTKSISAEHKQAVKDGLAERFGFLAKSLEGKPYLMGENFTIADGYAFYVLRSWQRNTGSKLEDFPPLKAYFERIAARPAVKAVLEAEGVTAYPPPPAA